MVQRLSIRQPVPYRFRNRHDNIADLDGNNNTLILSNTDANSFISGTLAISLDLPKMEAAHSRYLATIPLLESRD